MHHVGQLNNFSRMVWVSGSLTSPGLNAWPLIEVLTKSSGGCTRASSNWFGNQIMIGSHSLNRYCGISLTIRGRRLAQDGTREKKEEKVEPQSDKNRVENIY